MKPLSFRLAPEAALALLWLALSGLAHLYGDPLSAYAATYVAAGVAVGYAVLYACVRAAAFQRAEAADRVAKKRAHRRRLLFVRDGAHRVSRAALRPSVPARVLAPAQS